MYIVKAKYHMINRHNDQHQQISICQQQHYHHYTVFLAFNYYLSLKNSKCNTSILGKTMLMSKMSVFIFCMQVLLNDLFCYDPVWKVSHLKSAVATEACISKTEKREMRNIQLPFSKYGDSNFWLCGQSIIS